MKKRIFLMVIIVLAISMGGLFGWLYFSEKNTKKIEIKNETAAENDNVSVTEEVENSIPKEAEQPKIESQEKKEIVVEKIAPTDKTNITDNFVSWGYEKAGSRKIDTVIIHSTYNALGGDQFSLEKILDIYKSYGVAPHYIIDRGGKIYRLVADENIAYHAGESKMPDGRTGVNNFSIGIELINNKTDNFTSAQYVSLNDLLKYLHSKHAIKYVFGHDQIAPGRKDDPWNINWSKIEK